MTREPSTFLGVVSLYLDGGRLVLRWPSYTLAPDEPRHEFVAFPECPIAVIRDLLTGGDRALNVAGSGK